MDLKDIKEAVQDAVKLSEKNWQSEREADKKAFDEKMSNAIDEVAKAKQEVEDVKKKMDEMALETKNRIKSIDKPKTFKQALADTLKDEQENLVKSANAGKLINGYTMEVKDFNYDDFTGYEEFVTDYSSNIITNPYSSFHYRDIIPRGNTSKGFISYPKEGATTGAADTWMHTGDGTASKPEIAPSFAPYTVKVNWIAGIMKGIPVDMLEDLPWLTSFLQTKAMNELMKAEDLQIQEGSGVDPDLDGFFTGTNATAYDGSQTKFFAKIIDAAYRQVADSYYNANRAVISNTDKVNILLNTETGAGYNLPGGSVSVVNGRLNIAGLEVYSNSYLAEGQALIGDFNESQFVVRSAPRLRFFEQNGTDAEKNQIMVRIEERVALAIYSSLAFVKLTPST